MAMMKTSGLPVAFSWQDAWAGLPPRERAELMARQGHRYPLLEGLDVAVEAKAGGEAAGGEAAGGDAFAAGVSAGGPLTVMRSCCPGLTPAGTVVCSCPPPNGEVTSSLLARGNSE